MLQAAEHSPRGIGNAIPCSAQSHATAFYEKKTHYITPITIPPILYHATPDLVPGPAKNVSTVPFALIVVAVAVGEAGGPNPLMIRPPSPMVVVSANGTE